MFSPLNCVMLIMWHWGRIWYCIVSIVYLASHDPWLVIFPSIILTICCWPLKRTKSIETVVFFTQTQISGPNPSKTNQARVDNGHGRVCFYQNLKPQITSDFKVEQINCSGGTIFVHFEPKWRGRPATSANKWQSKSRKGLNSCKDTSFPCFTFVNGFTQFEVSQSSSPQIFDRPRDKYQIWWSSS